MIYFVVTHNNLHRSKKFCSSKKEVKAHVQEVLSRTKWKVSETELSSSVVILKIDNTAIPEYETIFRTLPDILPPWTYLEREKQDRQEQKEFSDFKKHLKEIKIC